MKRFGALFAACVWACASPSIHAQAAASGPSSFAPIQQLLTHPRCLNCHTTTPFPKQGDGRRPHDMQVLRGPEGLGVAAMKCSACHTAQNNGTSGVPGAPHWRLAPLSMGWEGLSERALCERLLDRKRNGNRSAAQIVDHITEDPLVAWAWAPGASRQPVTPSREKTSRLLHLWLAGGARCP
jgi:hypothetical protein